jgi:tetratricopeptide (TPR) repeat protein
VASLVLAMASKEDVVAAPLLVVLFERAFLLPTWSALRPRLAYYGALFATPLVLVMLVAQGPHNETVGYSTRAGVTAWQWLMTQAGVVVGYLRVSLVPYPLRTVHDTGIVRDFGAAVLPGAIVLGVLAVVVWSWRRHQWFGWLGAMFFLLLAPTSTIMPIVTEVATERRIYLPMLFVLLPVVIGVDRALRAGRVFGVLLAAVVALTFVLLTWQRVPVYADEGRFWEDALAKTDPDSRTAMASLIFSSHGGQLFKRQRFEEAHRYIAKAVECRDPQTNTLLYYAVSLQTHLRQHEECLRRLRELRERAPGNADVIGSIGTSLMRWYFSEPGDASDPRLTEAVERLSAAVQLGPMKAEYWNSLGLALREQGRLEEAEAALRKATEVSTTEPQAFFNRAVLLEQLGRVGEIEPMFARLLAARPGDIATRMKLANIYVNQRNAARVAEMLRQVLAIEPGNAEAMELIRRIGVLKENR